METHLWRNARAPPEARLCGVLIFESMGSGASKAEKRREVTLAVEHNDAIVDNQETRKLQMEAHDEVLELLKSPHLKDLANSNAPLYDE